MLRLILLFLLKNCLWVTRSPKGYQGWIWAPICSDMGADFRGWLALETPPEPPGALSRALLDPLGAALGKPLEILWKSLGNPLEPLSSSIGSQTEAKRKPE